MKIYSKSSTLLGASAVEFALVLPFLVIILFLTMDFGFMVYNKAVITNASREAARYGTVLTAIPWSSASVAAVACSYAKSSLISTKTGTRTSTCSGTADPAISVLNTNGNIPPNFGDPITVTIIYPYAGFLLNTTNAWMSNTTFPSLTAASTMNHE